MLLLTMVYFTFTIKILLFSRLKIGASLFMLCAEFWKKLEKRKILSKLRYLIYLEKNCVFSKLLYSLLKYLKILVSLLKYKIMKMLVRQNK